MPSFDLRYEPWIPATCEDGTHQEVSTVELFERAHTLREIGGDLPQQIMPILRLHLAILRRAFGNPDLNQRRLDKWWRETWEQGSFDAGVIREYLERFPEEFNLFGSHPFFQVTGLEYAQSKGAECSPISELMADVPKPDKYLFSTRAKTAPDSISYAEAARWLIFTQAYDVAGIKSPVVGNTHVNKGKVYAPKGIPSTGWAGCIGGVFLEGANVFQTLMWNLVLHDAARGNFSMFGDPDDLTPWERPMPAPDQRLAPATGVVDLETRQSRRMRLVASEDEGRIVGVVSCYGDLMHPSDALKFETMTSWRESKAQQKKLQTAYVPLMPVLHEGGKALWRGLASLISVSGENDGDRRPGVIRWVEHIKCSVGERGTYPERLTIRAQGMEYGTQSSVFTNGFDDSLSLGMALARHDSPAVLQAVSLVDKAEQAVFELVKLAQNVERIAGDKHAGTMSSLASSDVRERAYDEVDGLFRAYLAGLTEDVDAACYTDEYVERIRGCILGLGSEVVRATETPLFVSHNLGRSPSYLSQAQTMFVRNVNRLLSSSDEAGHENRRA